MSTQTLDQISRHWTQEITQGKASVPVERLKQANIPAHIREDLIRHGEAVLEDEINRIYDSPFLDRSIGPDKQDPREKLRNLLQEMMVLPDHAIERILQRTFRDILEEWNTQPVSLRQAAEAPDQFAKQIFDRAKTFVAANDDTHSFSVDVLAQVCDASGISPLDQVIRCEEELGNKDLTPDQLALITHRFLLLKEKYKISRTLVAFEGGARTLEAETPTEPEAAPVVEPPKKEAAPAAPVAAEPEAPVEEAPPKKKAAPEAAPKPAAKPTPAPEPKPAPAEAKPTAPAPEPAAEKPAIDAVEAKAPPSDIPKEIPQQNAALWKKLSAPDAVEEFAETMFRGERDSYLNMVLQVCRQSNWGSARVAADNQLFLFNVPITARPAEALLKIMAEHFAPGKKKDQV